MEQLSPATQAATKRERTRIPMSVPVQRLEVPDIPGYHLHWFRGDAERVERALAGGYEFVDQREAKPHSTSLGGTSTASGNTDMGSRVSVVSGSELGNDGQPVRLVLMKIQQDWYEEDQKLVDDRNAAVADSLTGGMLGASQDAPGDTARRYLDKERTKIPDFFKRKSAKKPAT